MSSPYTTSSNVASDPISNSNNLARLTSLATQTLTSLLERQRLASISRTSLSSPSESFPHPGLGVDPTPQITRNLKSLRDGILNYEDERLAESTSTTLTGSRGRRRIVEEETRNLRDQFKRMRRMLAHPDDVVEELEEPTPTPSPSPSPPPERAFERNIQGLASYMPYKDDPGALERGPEDGEIYQMNEQIMTDQDTRLDHLSHSINRQRDISLHINSELDVHTGLLEGLDSDLDRTNNRLGRARRQLDKFSRGMKGNGASIFIALLITVLLLLIVIFKT